MPLRVDESNPEQKVCFFTVENGEEIRICDTLEVRTDSDKAMSFVEIEGRRVYVTESEADALTVAGARDGRKHLKADESDSVI
ncbi:DUF3203 family protein [Pseudomonas fluorescens]|jgi:hypothetical protein|uniref:DUF3203 family protein n=1 Tax=Pseudomonas fluorescens TaxID=294 RepID=UPI0011328F07|nr:DUF3203 family protein [Pseudomonas fluorescens]TMU71945.1 DUF3203 family protein [Pseudomonas fluorescens]